MTPKGVIFLVRVWRVGLQSHPWEGYIIAVIRYPPSYILIYHKIGELGKILFIFSPKFVVFFKIIAKVFDISATGENFI